MTPYAAGYLAATDERRRSSNPEAAPDRRAEWFLGYDAAMEAYRATVARLYGNGATS